MTLMWSVAVLEPALPGRNRMANASPVPSGAVVEERRQRVEPEAAFERRGSVLFLRVGGDQGRVQIDDQGVLRVGAVVGCVVCGELSCLMTGRGPSGVDRLQSSGHVGGQSRDRPGHGRVGRDPTVDAGFGA